MTVKMIIYFTDYMYFYYYFNMVGKHCILHTSRVGVFEEQIELN